MPHPPEDCTCNDCEACKDRYAAELATFEIERKMLEKNQENQEKLEQGL